MRLPLFLILPLLLTSCAIAYTPERAAVQGLLFDRSVASETIQVRQVLQQNDQAYVLVSFQKKEEREIMDCLYLQEVTRTRNRIWAQSSGGGGCSGQPLGGMNPVSPLGLGTSNRSEGNGINVQMVYGLVGDPEIRTVQGTWDDGQTFQVNVINDSYLIVYRGQGWLINVSGVDQAGQVVSSVDWNVPIK